MPKVKIEAKKVLDDIRAGLDEAALMEKYNLSIKGLHSVLEKLVALKALDESYIWTGKPLRESVHPSANRELSAKEVTRDIKSGLTDGQLMRKYKLSSKGLQHLLEQLMEAGLIKEDDLEIGKPMMESTVELTSDILASETEDVPEPEDVTQPISEAIEASPPPEAAPVPVEPAPAPPEAAPSPSETAPKEPDPVALTVQPASAQGKPQEVQVTDTAEPAFSSTIAITVVARQEPDQGTPSPPSAFEKPHETPKQEPPEPPQHEPTLDLWGKTERVTVRVDEKPEEPAAPVEAPPSHQPIPLERPLSQDFTQTLELVWKCPACGQPQHQSYDECPVCGIVVAKFLDQQKKGIELETRIQEKKPEPKTPPVPVPEPAPPVVAPPRSQQPAASPKPEPSIKLRKPPVRPPAVQEEAPHTEPAPSGLFRWTLTGLAIAQLVVVLVHVVVQVILHPEQLSTAHTLAWSVAAPILISLVLAALLHAAAVLVKLNREILAETARNGHMLKTILTKKDERSE